jgi:mono/diheme cytochrome c family protein
MTTGRIHAVAALLVVLVAGCDQKMNYNGKVRPLSETTFFKDQRASRPQPEHTVARGMLKEDPSFYRGKTGNDLITTLPVPLTRETLARGRERFDIYCSPCHGRLGDGDGMIVSRGFSRPTSFHNDRLLTAPVGHFFDAMTNGFGRMPSYALQVPVEDRWAIAAYIRALQLSQHARVGDLSDDDRRKLSAEAPVK